MLNRTQAPLFSPIEFVSLPEIEKLQLANGLEIYIANFSQQDIIKLELVFEAGAARAELIGLQALFPKLMIGGTAKRSATEIVSQFDQYGGYIEVVQKVESFHITVYGLRRFLPQYLETLLEILYEPNFPENELETQKQIAQNALELNKEKSSYLATRCYKQLIFGETHPYGTICESEDIDAVQQIDLISFFEDFVKGKNFRLFVSGKVSQREVRVLSEYLGPLSLSKIPGQTLSFTPQHPQKRLIERPESMQSTLRIGKLLHGRCHPDFFKMVVCNTVFGGFFGSRLMKNIREEKGFTYGISSSVSPLANIGFYLIGSDVIKKHTLETLGEIEIEARKLQNEKVSDSELELVKNYLGGSFAGSLTTAFEIMDRHKNMVLENLPRDFYRTFIAKIREVTKDDVQQMAQQHLGLEGMSEVIVGERI